ncbi:MAG: hypothetical protein PHC34_07015 [Candidatus Gastranaerophilales bacterium]|nr:hypothetical protein [Candidatus Gastranaerophilales bacterium]
MDRTKRILVLSLIPMLLTLIFIIYLVVPTVTMFNGLNKEFKQEKSSYIEDKGKLDTFNNNNNLLKNIEELKQKLGNFDVNVPSEDDLSILLIDLEKFAESFNVKVIGLNSKFEAEKEIIDPKIKKPKTTHPVRKKHVPSPLYSISLEISAVGYYQDILNFINTLENYERKVAISGVKVENYREDKNTSNPRVQMTINCEVFKFNSQDEKEEKP